MKVHGFIAERTGSKAISTGFWQALTNFSNLRSNEISLSDEQNSMT